MDVHEDEVEMLLGETVERLLPVYRLRDEEALRFKIKPSDAAVERMVVDQQDPRSV